MDKPVRRPSKPRKQSTVSLSGEELDLDLFTYPEDGGGDVFKSDVEGEPTEDPPVVQVPKDDPNSEWLRT